VLAILLAIALATPPADIVRPQERVAYKAMLNEQALSADTVFAGSPCPTAQVQDLATQDLQVAGHAGVRVLHEKLEVTGCGRTSTQNLYVVRATGSPPWRMANTMPGESLADMGLQANVWTEAVKQARVDLPSDCRGQRLQDVYVTARPGHVFIRTPDESPSPHPAGWFGVSLPPNIASQQADLDIARAWVEVWPLELCGQDRTLAVIFIPMRDQAHSAYAFLPVWRIVQARGPGARPQPAPPTDEADSAPAVLPASPSLASPSPASASPASPNPAS
jgi:hypothetical protein